MKRSGRASPDVCRPSSTAPPVRAGAARRPPSPSSRRRCSRILHSESGANTLISLKVAGQSEARVLVKEYQLDPVTHQILHADFYRIAMDRVLRVTVPVTVKGEAPGVKQQGGILEFVHRIVEVECLPADIPEHIEVNVGDLMLHQGIRVRDVPVNPKWKAVDDADMMLVHVIMPKAEEAPAPAEAAAGPPRRPRRRRPSRKSSRRARRKKTKRRKTRRNSAR